jgi:nucleoside 2-deoxyribosyltransferase
MLISARLPISRAPISRKRTRFLSAAQAAEPEPDDPEADAAMRAWLVGALKRAICERHGLVGIFPADEEDDFDPASSLGQRALAISRAMERVMQTCDAMIVNLTPFRGPSADVGSAYEMGFMRALGRPIFAYTNDSRLFLERVRAFWGDAVRLRPTGEHEDLDGMAIEPFELHDNLMLVGGIADSGGCLVTETVPPTERYTSLAVFERCVAHAATDLLRGTR